MRSAPTPQPRSKKAPVDHSGGPARTRPTPPAYDPRQARASLQHKMVDRAVKAPKWRVKRHVSGAPMRRSAN